MTMFEDDMELLGKERPCKKSKRRKSQFKNRVVGKENGVMNEWNDDFDEDTRHLSPVPPRKRRQPEKRPLSSLIYMTKRSCRTL